MAEKISMIVTDLDGTFLNSKKEVTPASVEMLKKCKERGILFGFASGRPIETSLPLIRQWGLEEYISFIIGMNGSILYDCKTEQTQNFYQIPGSVALDIFEAYDDLDVVCTAMVGNVRYAKRSTPDSLENTHYYDEIEKVVDIEEFLSQRDVNKLTMYCGEELVPVVRARYEALNDSRVNGFSSAFDLFEFTDPRVNKGYGLQQAAKHFGVSMDETLAFGDASNDQSMIEVAKIGVCMANGEDRVKEASDFVTEETNDEDAVAKYVNRYVLKGE
ncbi:MAG: HAD family phosphatase [Erysipelotrichaceae bacterium]|nr:HAD family phosphatase [Erysipelotrichaceae bacterium]